MIHTGKVEMNSRLISMNMYDRLSGLGAKPILYRTININVIVFTA
jgi:hypothetical protein